MPISTAAAIVAVLILTVAVPLGTMLFLRKRGGTWSAFLTGAGTFILVAVVSASALPVAATELLVLAPTVPAALWAARIYRNLPPAPEA